MERSKESEKQLPLKGLKLQKCLQEFLFADLIFGHGEKPARSLLASSPAIVLFALLHLLSGGLGFNGVATSPRSPEFYDYFHFSFVTFTTLGYVDVLPKTLLGKLLADVEACLGVLLPAVFVVGLTKKYMR